MSYWIWNTDNDFVGLQNQISNMFKEFIFNSQDTDGDGVWIPPIDVYEAEDSIILVGDLPGVDQKDLRIQVENDKLVLFGMRTFGEEISRERYYRVEVVYGKFWRSFTLGCEMDRKKIKANLSDGVLTISLPKASKTQFIEVSNRQ